MNQDQIYSLPMNRVGDFEFDDQVADVFPDMIRRSVPGYGSLLSMIEQLSATYAVPGTNIYDLGCSLGAATFLMQKKVPGDCQIVAVDDSKAMVTRLKSHLDQSADSEKCHIEPIQADIRELDITNASFVVLNLTLQFIPESDRDQVLRRIAEGMLPGAALILSEKVLADDADQQAVLTALHHDFKKANGYSDLEIAQKRTAIENRLFPETVDRHVHRLRSAGFTTVVPWFQCFTFASLLAIR